MADIENEDIFDEEESYPAEEAEETDAESEEEADGVNMHRFTRLTVEEGGTRKLTGMYKEWFLDLSLIHI